MLIFVAMFIGLITTFNCSCVFAESLGSIISRTDWNCVHLEPAGGACRRISPPYVGVKMRYWQPVLLVETVKKPGETGINEFKVFTGEPLSRMARQSLGVKTGPIDSVSAGFTDTTAIQMNDVHVFGFPLTDTFSAIIEPVCEGAPDISSPVSYLSEMDALEWRTLRNEANNPMSRLTIKMAPVCDRMGPATPLLCVGSWGPLYPRGGFTTGASSAVGSALAAFRGVDLASANPLSIPHQRVMPLTFIPDILWDRLQMVSPARTTCLRPGENPLVWEEGKTSKNGTYVWVYWRKKECCAL